MEQEEIDLSTLPPEQFAELQRHAEALLQPMKWRLTEPMFARLLRSQMQARARYG